MGFGRCRFDPISPPSIWWCSLNAVGPGRGRSRSGSPDRTVGGVDDGLELTADLLKGVNGVAEGAAEIRLGFLAARPLKIPSRDSSATAAA
jgi:hypothetical protein